MASSLVPPPPPLLAVRWLDAAALELVIVLYPCGALTKPRSYIWSWNFNFSLQRPLGFLFAPSLAGVVVMVKQRGRNRADAANYYSGSKVFHQTSQREIFKSQEVKSTIAWFWRWCNYVMKSNRMALFYLSSSLLRAEVSFITCMYQQRYQKFWGDRTNKTKFYSRKVLPKELIISLQFF